MLKKTLLFGLFLTDIQGFAQIISTDQHSISCFSDQILSEQDERRKSDFNEASLKAAVERIETIYKPIVSSLQGKLKIELNWDDPVINAYANRFENEWKVIMNGGLIKHPLMTNDAVVLSLCHEIGHHLGGFPYVASFNNEWGASEGQADYYSTQVCAKKVWGSQIAENAAFRPKVDSKARIKCDSVYKQLDQQNLCYRILTASKSLMETIANVYNHPRPAYDLVENRMVSTTDRLHPKAQCRLDTSIAGALCQVPFDDKVIPARKHPGGINSKESELEANKYACHELTLANPNTTRPYCWYKPSHRLMSSAQEITLKQVSGNNDAFWDNGETFAVNLPVASTMDRTIEKMILTVHEKNNILNHAVSTYAPLAMNTKASATTPVTFALKDKKCGEIVPLQIAPGVGEWYQNHIYDVVVGGEKNALTISSKDVAVIPAASSEFIYFPLEADSAKVANRIELNLNIELASFLGVYLVSPQNREYLVFDGLDFPLIKKTFPMTISPEPIKGKWQLKIKNDNILGDSRLVSWSINFKENRCP